MKVQIDQGLFQELYGMYMMVDLYIPKIETMLLDLKAKRKRIKSQLAKFDRETKRVMKKEIPTRIKCNEVESDIKLKNSKNYSLDLRTHDNPQSEAKEAFKNWQKNQEVTHNVY